MSDNDIDESAWTDKILHVMVKALLSCSKIESLQLIQVSWHNKTLRALSNLLSKNTRRLGVLNLHGRSLVSENEEEDRSRPGTFVNL